MGTWDVNPWDNDTGAEWFGDMFDATGLAGHVQDSQKTGRRFARRVESGRLDAS